MLCLGNNIKSFSYKDNKKQIVESAEKIASKEGKKFSELILELLEKHVQIHGDGNPAYTLDQWQNNPRMLAIPALGSERETVFQYWQKIRGTKTWTEVELMLKNWIDSHNEVMKEEGDSI